MSALGDLLEALHRPAAWQRLHLTVEVWTHDERWVAAWQAGADRGGGAAVMWSAGETDDDAPPPQAAGVGEWVELWGERPDRRRAETRDPDGALRDVANHGGGLWLHWNHRGRAVSNVDEPEVGSGSGSERAGPMLELASALGPSCFSAEPESVRVMTPTDSGSAGK